MGKLFAALTRIELELRDMRANVTALREYLEAMKCLGLSVVEEQLTIETLIADIAHLSSRESRLLRLQRALRMRARAGTVRTDTSTSQYRLRQRVWLELENEFTGSAQRLRARLR